MTTSSAIATRNGSTPAQPTGALAISPGQSAWEDVQVAAFAQIGIDKAPDGDRQVFLHVSQRTGLDPFARQIYMIPRNEKVPGTRDQWRVKWGIQTGIEGWRVIRDRAERREGVRGTLSRAIFYDDDNNEYKVWVRRDPPAACELTYTVRDANGTETPYTSTVNFWEYAQTDQQGNLVSQWRVKKAHMLEKCTEADVYRKAFPQDYSGIELADAASPEHMTDAELDAAYRAVQRPRVTAEQARQRAPQRQQPQRVRSEVVPPEDAPWPGDAQPDARAPQPEAEPYRDPRDAVRTALAALGIGATLEVADYVMQITGANVSADLTNLTREQAEDALRVLSGVSTRKELDELAATGEAGGHGE